MAICTGALPTSAARSPMQFPTQGQWWSIFSTHTPHREQWWARGGFGPWHLRGVSSRRHVLVRSVVRVAESRHLLAAPSDSMGIAQCGSAAGGGWRGPSCSIWCWPDTWPRGSRMGPHCQGGHWFSHTLSCPAHIIIIATVVSQCCRPSRMAGTCLSIPTVSGNVPRWHPARWGGGCRPQ